MKVNRITILIALVLGLALFAGTAIAGNGHGNGNGNGNAPSADSTAAANFDLCKFVCTEAELDCRTALKFCIANCPNL